MNEESKSQNAQNARNKLNSQDGQNRDEDLLVKKRERMNKTSNLSKIEDKSNSNILPPQ